MSAVKACIFDVDGLLIDSEDIYTEVMNNVLHAHGVPDSLPWSVKAEQQSRGREGMIKVLEWAKLDMSVDDFMNECKAQRQIFKKSQLLPGVQKLLVKLASVSSVEIAIASSAARQTFHIKTDHLPVIAECIPENNRVFGSDPEMVGKPVKPAPDLFLMALERINQKLRMTEEREIQPSQCLVFEDSTAGVEAGLRAGMQVVWVPHPGLREVYRGREDLVLFGKSEYSDDVAHEPIVDSGESEMTYPTTGHETGDMLRKRANMLKSLDEFPFQQFGIKVIA